MVISKSIEFVDTYCHTMLTDREAFLSHGRISRIVILVFGRYYNKRQQFKSRYTHCWLGKVSLVTKLFDARDFRWGGSAFLNRLSLGYSDWWPLDLI